MKLGELQLSLEVLFHFVQYSFENAFTKYLLGLPNMAGQITGNNMGQSAGIAVSKLIYGTNEYKDNTKQLKVYNYKLGNVKVIFRDKNDIQTKYR